MNIPIFVKRLIAAWIDYVIAFVISFVLHVIIFGAYPTFVSALILMLTILVLLIFRDILCINKSIGKMILSLKIVSAKKKLRLWQLVLRNVTVFIFPIEIILLLIGERRLGEIITGTSVVQSAKDKCKTE